MISGGAGAKFIWATVLGIGVIAAALLVARYSIKLFRFGTPERRIERIGQAMLRALIETGEIEDAHIAGPKWNTWRDSSFTWLKGGSMWDKTIFACCMEEIWGIIDNPRYLLMREAKARTTEYYSVPEVFGRQKERALIFEKHMLTVLRKYRVIYTRTPEGRKILLRARAKSFVNKNQQALLGRKMAKGRYG